MEVKDLKIIELGDVMIVKHRERAVSPEKDKGN